MGSEFSCESLAQLGLDARIDGDFPTSTRGYDMPAPACAMLLLVVCLNAASAAATPRVAKNLDYASTGGRATSLDVYAPANGADLPVMVWIHGGAWQFGDKSSVQAKPQAFNDKGFVLVSVNYRLLPDAGYQEQAADIAKALRWVHDHITDYGGAPDRVFIMGHSAGATWRPW